VKYLTLSGHGIKIHVNDGKLHVQDGRSSITEEPFSYTFRPKMIDFDNIVIYGHSGHITFEAMRWLVKQNTQLTLLNWDGKLLTTILPPEAKQTTLKFVQYRAYESDKKILLARKFIEAKIRGTNAVLVWLEAKYPEVSTNPGGYSSELAKANTIERIMYVEGMAADFYWRQLSKLFDKKFEFASRNYGKTARPLGAVDPINALFNYGYALLESNCLRAINAVGLDPHVGFLHKVQNGKNPLVYDLQEPFRWLVDLAILTAMEKKVFSKKDFIRTENYNIRLRPSGAKKLAKEIEARFNKTVSYLGNGYSWSYVLTLKAKELAQYLSGKKNAIDFCVLFPHLEREDGYELRQKILKLSYSEAKKLGIGKGSLWYMKHNALSGKPFKTYNKIKEKLDRKKKKAN
jgi:CRISPR-associated protein Cas1